MRIKPDVVDVAKDEIINVAKDEIIIRGVDLLSFSPY